MLTTVRQPVRELAATTARLLADRSTEPAGDIVLRHRAGAARLLRLPEAAVTADLHAGSTHGGDLGTLVAQRARTSRTACLHSTDTGVLTPDTDGGISR